MTMIVALVPDYFQEFDFVNPVYDEWEAEAIDMPEHIVNMIAYIQSHAVRRPDMRSCLEEEKQVFLTGLELQMSVGLKDHEEDVSIVAWHLQVKRIMEVSWNADYSAPRPGVLYVLFDHMAL